MSNVKEKIIEILQIVSFILVLALITGFLFLFGKVKVLSEEVKNLKEISDSPFNATSSAVVNQELTCTDKCENEIQTIIAETLATSSSQTKTTITQTSTTSGPKTAYVPLGPLATTISTDWVSVPDSAVYMDVQNDYGNNPYITWEVSLKIANGNGKAFARIYDDTHKIAVNGSELSTTANADYIYVYSGKLPFWKGRNLYKVQIKSLSSYEVTMSSPKIKVVY